jgi:ferrous iron transport protein A
MGEKRQITVRQMQPGQSGTVVEILEGAPRKLGLGWQRYPGKHGPHKGRGHGGYGFIDRLHSLGIRPGRRVTKVSGMFMRGPVTLQVGRAQVAIGYGMAGKILVEVDG